MRFATVPIETLFVADDERLREDPEQGVGELAESINEQFLFYPLLVRVHPDKEGCYDVLDGERRLRAYRDYLKRTSIDILIVDGDPTPAQLRKIRVLANTKRRSLTPYDVGRAALGLIADEAHLARERQLSGKPWAESDAGRTLERVGREVGCGKTKLAQILEVMDAGQPDLIVSLQNGGKVDPVWQELKRREEAGRDGPLPTYQEGANGHQSDVTGEVTRFVRSALDALPHEDAKTWPIERNGVKYILLVQIGEDNI